MSTEHADWVNPTEEFRAALSEERRTVDMTEFVLARIADEAATWSAAEQVATSEAETYCCRDALRKLSAQQIMVEGGLAVAEFAEDRSDHPDYRQEWKP